MTLKPTYLILFGLFVFSSACRKPKKGNYKIIFTNTQGYKNEHTCIVSRSPDEMVLSGNDSYSVSGKLNLYNGKTDGTINTSHVNLSFSSNTTYKVEGTYNREGVSGTYTVTSSSPSYSGTFQIGWRYED